MRVNRQVVVAMLGDAVVLPGRLTSQQTIGARSRVGFLRGLTRPPRPSYAVTGSIVGVSESSFRV